MSIQALNWAFGQTLPMSEKFTLVVLANYADEQHSCFPSQGRIAADMGAHETTVRRNIRRLEDAGFVSRSKRVDKFGHRTSDRYRLAVGHQIPTEQNAHQADCPPGTVLAPTEQSAQSLPSNLLAPTEHSARVSTNEPPVEPSENHQGGRASASTARGTRLPDGWMPKPETIQQMRDECPGVNLEAEHRRFMDYWADQPGAKGRKVRWDSTWRNWIRRANEDTRRGGRQTAADRNLERGYQIAQRYAQTPQQPSLNDNPFEANIKEIRA